jgi:RNA polymerase sigma factor (sigma-70 family)
MSMSSHEAPYYIGFVQSRVVVDQQADVYKRAGQIIDGDSDIYLENKVAINMLLGQYIVVKGEVEIQGLPILPEQLPEFGIVLSRKKRNEVIEQADSSIREAVTATDLVQDDLKWKVVGSEVRDPRDGTRLYLDKAAEYAISNRAERAEKMLELNSKVQKGLAAKQSIDNARDAGKRIDVDWADSLRADIETGERAKNDMTLINLLLAPHFAKRIVQGSIPSLTFDDLVQEFTVYMMDRSEKWNPDIATFASFVGAFAVRHLVNVGDESGYMIRVPSDRADEIKSINRIISEREAALYRSLTVKEIHDVELAHLKNESSVRSTRMAQRARVVTHMPYQESMTPAVEELSAVDNDTARLRAKRTNSRLVDDSSSPEAAYEKVEIKQKLEKLLSTGFNDRQVGIIRMRNGLTDNRMPMTHKEIAAIYGITASRVQQIESNAMSRLRSMAHVSNLSDYLKD